MVEASATVRIPLNAPDVLNAQDVLNARVLNARVLNARVLNAQVLNARVLKSCSERAGSDIFFTFQVSEPLERSESGERIVFCKLGALIVFCQSSACASV